MNNPLPADAKRVLTQFEQFIKAVYPSATDIEFIDNLSKTIGYRKIVQFTLGEQKGIAIIGAWYNDKQIEIECPYNPIAWRYNQ